MLHRTRNSAWIAYIHQITVKKFQLDPRKMEVEMVHDVRQTFSLQNAQSGTLGAWWVHFKSPSGPAAAHVHGEAVGHLGPDPPPLSETAWPFARKNTFFKKIR